MPAFLEQIFRILVEPPGNLIYHLVVVFAALAGIQSVFLLESQNNRREADRIKIGFLVVVAGQIFMFIVSALGWQNIIDPLLVMPLLDRFVIVITVIWVGWMVLNPPPGRLANLVVGIFTLVAFVLFSVALVLWQPLAGQTAFNGSAYDIVWMIFLIALTILESILLVKVRPANWSTALGFFVVVFAGGILHLLLPYSGSDYPAAVRLALICVVPLFPGMVRVLKDYPEPAKFRLQKTPNQTGVLQENQTRTIQAWSQLAAAADPDQVETKLVQAVGLSIYADFAAWLDCGDLTGPLIFTRAINLAKNIPIVDRQLPRDSMPLLTEALQKNRSILLNVRDDKTEKDLDALASALDISGPLQVMAVPVRTEKSIWSGLIAVSSRAGRVWSGQDRLFFSKLAEEASATLAMRTAISTRPAVDSLDQKKYAKSQQELTSTREELRLLLDELNSLRMERETLQTNASLESMIAIQHEAQKSIASLEEENNALRRTIQQQLHSPARSDDAHLEQELRSSLEELARLQNALAEANITIMNLQQQSYSPGQPGRENLKNLASCVQKLDEPVSSLMAFTDFLKYSPSADDNQETEGIVEQIREETNKLKAILDELKIFTEGTSPPVELAAALVSFQLIVDNVFKGIAPTLESKNISLIQNLPDFLPVVFADRDALEQIVVYLLQNAAAVTPPHGAILVNARIAQGEESRPYLIFQVTDEGGGIPSEEMGKVFDRDYRVKHPSIPGVGDRGMGLVITRTLVEAHSGRIWVESPRPGASTFSILLPVVHQNLDGARG